MRSHLTPALLLIAIAAGSAVCRAAPGDPVEIGRVVGILPHAAEALVAPDTVLAGVPFAVVVNTRAPNTCWREAGLQTSAQGNVVTLIPYDAVALPPEGRVVCGNTAVVLPRTASLRFADAGPAVLRLYGKGPDDTALRLEREIFVGVGEGGDIEKTGEDGSSVSTRSPSEARLTSGGS